MAYAELSMIGDKAQIAVTTSWNEKELIKSVPGAKWDPDSKTWYVPRGWAACVQLRGVFGQDLHIGDHLNQWAYGELQRRVTPSVTLRARHELLDTIKYKFDERLYDFQEIGSLWLTVAGDALLTDEMGTGKTVQALTALRRLHRDGKTVFPALVIGPNSTKLNWERETRTWFPEAEPIVIDGTPSEKTKQFQRAKKLDNAVVIINIEAVRNFSKLAAFGSVSRTQCKQCNPKYGQQGVTAKRCETHMKDLNDIPFASVIIDEAHRIKDPRSKQTRAVWAVCHAVGVERRWALTGTPLANHPGDLWSVLHAVAPYEYPTKSKFVDRYCLAAWNSYGGLDIVGIRPEYKDEFFKFLDPRLRRMPKALVLPQLPQKVRSWRHVEMTPKQKKAYKEIEAQSVTQLDDGSIVVAQSNLAAQVRLLQFASAYATVDVDPSAPSGQQVVLHDPSPKVDALMEIIDERGEAPIAVSAMHKQVINLACKRLDKEGILYGRITGDETQWQRDRALKDAFEGKIQVLLFTLAAGGTGLTMTFTDTLVRLQRDWSMINNKQGEDRVHRIGSEVHESINIIDVITRGTVEEPQLIRYYEKMHRLEEIVRDKELLRSKGLDIAELEAEEARILNSYLGVV